MDSTTCPKCGNECSNVVDRCPQCGETILPGASTTFSEPPKHQAGGFAGAHVAPGTSALMPTKNPDSLVSYYLGLFSIMPCFGLPMGAIAVIKGRQALQHAKIHPEDKGKSHAFVGIGCGAFGFLFNLAAVLFLLTIWLTSPPR